MNVATKCVKIKIEHISEAAPWSSTPRTPKEDKKKSDNKRKATNPQQITKEIRKQLHNSHYRAYTNSLSSIQLEGGHKATFWTTIELCQIPVSLASQNVKCPSTRSLSIGLNLSMKLRIGKDVLNKGIIRRMVGSAINVGFAPWAYA